jgi:hypothetical protein
MTRRAPPPEDLFGWRPGEDPHAVEQVKLVDIELRRLPERDTDHAFCVQKCATARPVYLPRKLTELHGPVFTFPRWLAVEKGLL